MAAAGPFRPQGSSRQSIVTRQRQLVRDAVSGLGFMATITLTKAFAAAVNEVGATQSKQLHALADVFKRVQTDRNARQAIHLRIGRLAQTSTIQAYAALITSREGPAGASHYRAGAGRFAGGKMLAALSDPGFVEAGPDGINFGNTAVLDRAAAQWHRLAFGAAGRGAGGHSSYAVTFNGLTVAALGLEQGPSPAFRMPRGFFVTPGGEIVRFGQNPNGSDLFYPGGRGGVGLSGRQSAGIAARNFFDAGIRRMATELGPAYQAYYRDLLQRALAGKGPLAGTVLVQARTLPTAVARVEADAL